MAATYTLLPASPYLVETTGSSVRVVPLLPRYLELAQDANKMASSKSSKESPKRNPFKKGKKNAAKEKTPNPPSSPLSSPPPSPSPQHVDSIHAAAPSHPHNLSSTSPTADSAPHAGPSRTPHAVRPEVPSNTPGNFGSAFNSAFAADPTHYAYRPYLLEDLKDVRTIPVDDFYHTVLGLPRDWQTTHHDTLVGIARDADFMKSLKSYIKCVNKVNSETNMYQPFVDLLHCVFAALEGAFTDLKENEKRKLRSARNDPAYIQGSDSNRKPDIILSTLGLITQVLNGPQKSFFWAQLLAFVEFKLEKLKSLANELVRSFERASKSGEPSSEIIKLAKFARETGDAPSAPSTSRPSISRHAQMSSFHLASLESPTKKSGKQLASSAGPSAGSSNNRQFAVPADPVRSTHSTSGPVPISTDLSRTRSGMQRSNASAGSKRNHATMEGLISTDHAQVKKPKIDPAAEKCPNRYVQCASYALELLSYGGWRSHALGILVTDNVMEFIYYDHSIVVQSEPFDFCSNPFSFITGLYGLCRLTLEEWGLHPFIPRPLQYKPKEDRTEKEFLLKTEAKGRPSTEMFKGVHVKLQDGTELELGDTIHLQHCLIGRGTCMIRVTPLPKSKSKWVKEWFDERGATTGLVMKLSWPAKTRLNEAEILQEVREKAEELNDLWVLDHLPEVLYTEDYDEETRKATASEGKGKGKAVNDDSNDLWKTLSQRLLELFGDGYEQRVLRVIISSELSETHELIDVKDTYNVFHDVFRCYRWLYEICGIMHRDLSHSNIMWRKRKMRIVGVLNDFDLVSRVVSVENQEPSSKHRTGTKPFMAMDLLSEKPPLHIYRHDLESLLYVMLWHTHRFEDGRVVSKPAFDSWAKDSAEHVLDAKYALIFQAKLPEPLPQHAELHSLLEEYRLALGNGLNAMRNHFTRLSAMEKRRPAAAKMLKFNVETLGDQFSFDVVENIFLNFAPESVSE
ncbi:hypothetical protein EIP91_005525 [Steccherinum ochraceum]|uniref:Protein kinase domain-containing protein n=1 Tax=Steccherinum ochraceum TaxID=92696 RepID=A0A4R0RZ88_9APHY|nr:hypothetical protein EIP91_005525 [Steccherinum ochraceum]